MTLAVTPEPASQSPPAGVQQFTSAADAAAYIAGQCLQDGALGTVGLEIEAHCFDLADPLRRPGWEQINAVIADVPNLPGRSLITLEPGGAVELSGPPMPDVVAAIDAMASDRAVLRSVFADAGLGLVLLGADPLRPPHRVNPGARYEAMERFFAASGTASPGAAMMTSTAAIQVNIEAGPRHGWAERVRLAHALGPVMIAIAANSPLLSSQFTGWLSSRQWVWSQLDSARCGPILGVSADDPTVDWARYAVKAPVMLVHTPEAVPVTSHVPFADWADGRALLGDRLPTPTDLDYHLTTLFPPVRPRRFLEIRYLDSVGDHLWPAVVFTMVTLLDDPEAAAVAAEATAPVATAWDLAARAGLGDRHLREAAVTCVRAAAERAPASLVEPMARLLDQVGKGRCAADDFADLAVQRGIPSAVGHLAEATL